ncbi:hexokinase-2 isoform X2 [Octopus sinensis]|uniref:Phosphotransferase n=1 Tax=Octopus sinensis TaxID=2607531 RepID=A0A6P7T2I6_9MOLL|nr:hexokinase-2 isoform X2 [Octopus sinensis]XP_036364588.1 hexokinase-2 isoform X2 [Octopus sinensis]
MHQPATSRGCSSPRSVDESSIETIVRPFKLNDMNYREIMHLMIEKFKEGLSAKTNPIATVKMFPTYVRSTPKGTEVGDFLALDLGGTNFRVLHIKLDGQDTKMESKIFLIPQKIMSGTGTELFDHIADCIYKFVKEQQLLTHYLPLGFTFSFPCRQEGLDKAILTTWTKGFKCEGVEGENIVELLHAAIKRKGQLNIKCVAVINDTVGALMSCAHSDRMCSIGIILGTGTNACYIERLENVDIWNEDKNEPKQVIINTEWGAFGDDGCLDKILTDYDRQVDKHSINPGKQRFEKTISGMYMGELVRLILEKLRRHKLIFNGVGSEELSTRGRFYTKYVSEIESDIDDSFKNTKQVFQDLNLTNFMVEDCRIAQYVCSTISTRAAYLSAAGTAALIHKMGRSEVTVAVDGSLYRFHPHFHDLMVEKIKALCPLTRFRLMLSHDGSGKGAAIVASCATQEGQNQNNNSALRAEVH